MIVDRRRFAREMEMEESEVRELYAVFAQELASDLDTLRQGHACGDAAGYARALHKIKGTSASYLAEELHACLERADALVKAGSPEAAMDMIGEVSALGAAVLQEIAVW